MDVTKNAYGLTDEDILYADDKALNQFVSLKKIQPYRPDEGQVNMQTLRKKKHEVKKTAERNKVNSIESSQNLIYNRKELIKIWLNLKRKKKK